MPNEQQGVVPMIAYEDGPAALEWLSRAFGFHETARMLGKNGLLSHGEMDTGRGMIMLATPSPDYESPRHHRESCARAEEWSRVPWVIDGILVYVDHVDQHFERAKANGATMLSPLEDGPPGRRYRAEDLEGHRWMFMERERA